MKLSIRRNAERWLLVAVAALSLASLPLLAGTGSVERDTVRRNSERIASLSRSEREQLDRNFAVYESLTEEQQGHYRALHAAVSHDDKTAKVLENYHDWLRTLSPGQRYDLNRESRPVLRMHLVRTFRDQQREASERRMREFSGVWDPDPGDASRLRLDPDELEQVVDAFISALPIPDERRDGLLDLPRKDRYREMLREIVTIRERSAIGGNTVSWPGLDVIPQIVAAIPDRRIRDRIDLSDPERARFALTRAVFRGIWGESYREAESRMPDEKGLQKFFGTLSGEQQERVMRMSPHEAKWELRKLYKDAHPEDFRDLEEIGGLMRRLFAASGPRRGPRSDGPPGRRDDRDGRSPRPFGRGPGL